MIEAVKDCEAAYRDDEDNEHAEKKIHANINIENLAELP